jgi:hypothetical protein
MGRSRLRIGVNDIETSHPEVARQWHPTKNGDLEPHQVYKGSCKKVWWQCPKGDDHEWQAPPANRTRGKNASGCPFCSGYRACKNYNLKTEAPQVALDWHTSRNGALTPEHVTPGTEKKVWWTCRNNPHHEYMSSVAHRTRPNNPTACPICSGKQLHPDNQLSAQYPDLSREWHEEKNGDLRPEQVTAGSGRIVWWQCKVCEEHKWKTAINNRTKNGTGCPFCSGRKADSKDNLTTKNPELAAQWHPFRNGSLTPDQFKEKSNTRVWWQCSKVVDHEWQAQINNRSNGNGCPFCAGRQASDTYNLENAFPNIAKEWHHLKNGGLTPDKVTPGSGIMVWWQCQIHQEHEWKTTINSRVRGANCPDCHPQSSIPEYRVYAEVKSIFPDAINRDRSHEFEFDIFIPSENIGIEHDGSYFHRGKSEQDLEKNKRSLSKGIRLIRVRNSPLEKLSENDVIYSGQSIDKECLNLLVRELDRLTRGRHRKKIDEYLSSEVFLGQDEFERLASFLPAPPLEQSLANRFAELANEWHPAKNGSLLPQHVRPQSNRVVWWKCSKGVDHEWEAPISNRSVQRKGCPFCSKRKADLHHNLKEVFPAIAAQWHPDKNGVLKPEDFTPRSRAKVWWKCPKGIDHEWQSLVQTRTDSRSNLDGCPFCANKRPSRTNNLDVLYPELSRQWHPTKNKDLKPEDFLPGSDWKAWWKCSANKNHEWEARIANRARLGRGCPFCNKTGKRRK